MKKIRSIAVFLGLIMACSTSLKAQVEQDHWMFGASSSLSFNSADLDTPNLSKQKSISLAGRFGYALKDNFMIGLDLGFSNTTVADNSTREIKIGPFTRYYFPESLFVGLGYSAVNRKVNEGERESTTRGLVLSLETGYPIWIFIDSLTIEPTISYGIGMGDSFKGTRALRFNLGFVLYF